MKKFFLKFNKLITPILLIGIIIIAYFIFFNKNIQTASAGWWNDSWHYRKSIQITNNVTTETNVYASTTIDTSDTTKFQADCGDLRFTKYVGEVLPYYIVSGCGTATTTVHINFETFEAGTQTIFYYYGNPTADNGFTASDFSTEASDYTIGTVGSEEIGGGPVGYWSFNEGYGATAHDESSGGNDGTITGAVWKDESECIAGKCLWFDGVDLTRVEADVQDNMNEFTACTWFKANSLTNGESETTITLLAKQFALNFNNSGRLNFFVRTSGSYPRVYSSDNIDINKWYHVCGVYYGVGVYSKLFIDGVDNSDPYESGTGTQTDDSSSDLLIGATSGGYESKFNGYIDEVKIYPYARTADQVKQDYNAGLAGQSSSKGTAASFGSKSDKWLSDGLVGHWKMDEASWNGTAGEVIDASGNGNNGTRYVNATTTAGKYGRGGYFDGSSYLQMPDTNNDFDFGTGDFTLSTWVKTTNGFNCTGGKGILNRYHSGVVAERFSCSTGGVAHFSLWLDGDQDFGGDGTTIINDGEWHHVVGIKSGHENGKILLYVDGVLDRESASNYTADKSIVSTEPFQVGRLGGAYYLTGNVDETRVYNRALSQDEVKKLYEYAPGPVLHLKMDEKVIGDYKTLYDMSGNGNNGTTYGATAAGLNCSVQGKYGSACSFSGAVGDYVNCGTNASLEVQDHTFSAWIYPEAVNYDATGIIASKADNINDGGVEWGIDGSDIMFAYNDGAIRAWYRATNSDIVINEWQYVTMSWNSSAGEVNFYVNGIKTDTTITTTGTIVYVGDMFRIDRQSNNNNFNGKIDDIKLYNYVRTQKQILEDMAGTSAGASASRGGVNSPILDMDFDEGFGATAHNKGIGGASLNGTLTPGAGGTNTNTTQMWSLDGKNGKAMEFDGTDDYVDLGDDSISDFITNEQNFTVSTWIYPRDDGTVNQRVLQRTESVTPENVWQFIYDVSTGNGKIVWTIRNEGSQYDVMSDTALTLNAWHNIIGSVSWSGGIPTVKIFINGIENNGNPGDSLGSGDDNSFYIGIRNAIGNNPFDGMVDEVKIYNYALTEDDIKTVYNSGVSSVMGSSGTDSATGGASNAASGEYCVPGDTSICDAPVLHLKMDEKTGTTAYDVSGNGNDGTLGGGTANYKPTWTTGKYGSALNFDGYDDEVYVGDILDSQSNLTVSAWVKWNTAYVNDERAFIVLKDYAFMLRSADTGHNFLFAINDGSWHESGNTTTSIDDGNWHHLVGLYNNEDVKIYVDGVEENSNNIGSTITASNANILEIGGANYNWASQHWNWNGQIDDVRIYNYARTPAQIAWDYNKGKPIAEWKFDECQGTVIHNDASTGSIFHGTLNQGATGITVPGTCKDGLSTSAWYLGSTGHQKASMYFDGLSDYVEILDNDLLDFTNSLTLSAWIKPTAAAQSLYSRIISKTPTGGGNELYALVTDNSPSNAPGIRITVGSSVTCFGNSIAPLNEWTHVLGTWNGTVGKLYFNGVLENTCAIAGTLPSATSNLRIGDREDSPDNRRFKGMIDEVEIFNYVLTDEQIKNEFNSGAVRFGE